MMDSQSSQYTKWICLRACLSIFIHGKTNKSFRACVKWYMERQAKSGKKLCLGIQDKEIETHIKQNLSLDFFQTYSSRRVWSLCIWRHSHVKLELCAMATSLPSTDNLFFRCKQPRNKHSGPCRQILRGLRNERCQQNNCWTRTTLSGTSNKSTQCTNQKGEFKWNFVLQSWIMVWTF